MIGYYLAHISNLPTPRLGPRTKAKSVGSPEFSTVQQEGEARPCGAIYFVGLTLSEKLVPVLNLKAWISDRPESRPLVSSLYPFTVLSSSCWIMKFCWVGFQLFNLQGTLLEVFLRYLVYEREGMRF
jgi:hypothetical protein